MTDVVSVASVLDIHRIRRLPFPGNILVKVGESVHPENVIAEAFVPGEILMLDVVRGLGISPSETAACLVRELGENLKQGDVIAQFEGAFPRLIRAPVEGTLMDCHQGRVVLATGVTYFRIQAGIIGVVEDLIPEYGAVLSTRGSLLQGVWGNGRVGAGVLKVIDLPFEDLLEPSNDDSIESGQLLATGKCLHADSLAYLVEIEPAGLIFGGLSPELIPIARELPMPVIVLQGFGDLPPDPDLMALLKSREGEMASVNACESNLFDGVRPEVIIPKAVGESEKELGFRVKLAVGQWVRVLSGKALGQAGEVVELLETRTEFESGLALQTAVIQLQNGETTHIPQQNLIILH